MGFISAKQYKVHDVSDWIGEQKDIDRLDGFVFKSGRVRETTGIWMWSEIFTHDFDNGDKVAIILLDTQGIFDLKSSLKEFTTIFALSTMFSSVQSIICSIIYKKTIFNTYSCSPIMLL